MDDMNNINILVIVDHKINHADKIRYENIGNLILITSSVYRNSNNASFGGIGIMVDRFSLYFISEIKNGPNVYDDQSQWKSNDNNTNILFLMRRYKLCRRSLLSTYTTIPKHNVLLTVEDVNAYIGSHDTANKFTFH